METVFRSDTWGSYQCHYWQHSSGSSSNCYVNTPACFCSPAVPQPETVRGLSGHGPWVFLMILCCVTFKHYAVIWQYHSQLSHQQLSLPQNISCGKSSAGETWKGWHGMSVNWMPGRPLLWKNNILKKPEKSGNNRPPLYSSRSVLSSVSHQQIKRATLLNSATFHTDFHHKITLYLLNTRNPA